MLESEKRNVALAICGVLLAIGVLLALFGPETPTRRLTREVEELKAKTAAMQEEINTLKGQMTALTLDVRATARDLMLTRQALPDYLESNAKQIAGAAAQSKQIVNDLQLRWVETEAAMAVLRTGLATDVHAALKAEIGGVNSKVDAVSKKVNGISLDSSSWSMSKQYCKCSHK